jgi:hypothetical protein
MYAHRARRELLVAEFEAADGWEGSVATLASTALAWSASAFKKLGAIADVFDF